MVRVLLGMVLYLGLVSSIIKDRGMQEFMDSLPEQAKTLLKSLFGDPADDQGSETASTGELQQSTSEQLGLNDYVAAAVKLIRQSEGTLGETGANKFFSGKFGF